MMMDARHSARAGRGSAFLVSALQDPGTASRPGTPLQRIQIVKAWTDEGEIMGLMHTELNVHGVQFHPESVLTQDGMKMMQNFLEL